MSSIDHILSGFRNKPSRSLDSAYKVRLGSEDDIVTYMIMTLSVFFIGIIILVKLFTGL